MSPVTPHPSTLALHEVLGHFLAEWTEAGARERRPARPAGAGAGPEPVRVAYVARVANNRGPH
ncbi:MAG: hypothetical protein ABW277_06895, partial [Longimicrobiaceae bacterium]